MHLEVLTNLISVKPYEVDTIALVLKVRHAATIKSLRGRTVIHT